MELEQRRRVTLATSKAHGFEPIHRHALLLPSQGDRRGQADIGRCVSQPMTVRAEEIALRSFGPHLLIRSTEVGQAEQLGSRISMVELKGFQARGVTTRDASATVGFNKFTFSTPPTLSERSTELFAPALASSGVDVT